MKPTLKISFGILLITSSLFLVSMAPGGGPKGFKRHIEHKGVKLCLSNQAFEAHHSKHIGIMDCEVVSDCTSEACTFHLRK